MSRVAPASHDHCIACGDALTDLNRSKTWPIRCKPCVNKYHRERRRAIAEKRDHRACASCGRHLPVAMFKRLFSGRRATKCLDCITGPGLPPKRTPADWMADPAPAAYICEAPPPPRTADSPYWQMMDLCDAAEARIKATPSATALDVERQALDDVQADIRVAKTSLKALLIEIVAAQRRLNKLKHLLRQIED